MDKINDAALSSALLFHGSSLARRLLPVVSDLDDEASAAPFAKIKTIADQSRDRPHRASASELKTADERNFADRLQGFIAQKFPALYRGGSKYIEETSTNLEGNERSSDRGGDLAYGACPAIETYMHISARKLKDRFFTGARPGDCVCGEIRSVEEVGITVRLLCVDAPTMQRYLEDLRLDVFVPKSELIVPKVGDDPFGIYCKHKLVRAVVSAVNTEKHHLTVVLKSAASLGTTTHRQLGIISESDLPAYFRGNREDDGSGFDTRLRRSEGFLNPHSVDNLCRHFGLDSRALSSLSPSLISTSDFPSESAKELRKMQSYRLAMKSVVKGIERLRNKQNAEAMQHFNKALDIDPENVEGLVGRGALYANCDSYEFAIRDFDRALALDSSHTNARLYLTETLLAQGKAYEKRRRRQKAIDCYDRILELNPDNDDATKRRAKLTSAKIGETKKAQASPKEVVDISSSSEEQRDSEREGSSSTDNEARKVSARKSTSRKRSSSSIKRRDDRKRSRDDKNSGSRHDRRSRSSRGVSSVSSKDGGRRSTANGRSEVTTVPNAKPAEDVKLNRQLSDMEKFIAGLKAKRHSSDNA